MEGLRSASKYSVNYFLCEIILTFFAFSWLADKLASRYPEFASKIVHFLFDEKIISKKDIVSLMQFLLICSFLILSFASTTMLSFRISPYTEREIAEINLLKENVNFDKSCWIIKVFAGQPNIDYYFGLQKNALFFGFPPGFYDSIKNYEKKGKCFYYYDEKFYTENDYKYEFVFKLNLEKVDESFASCNRTLEAESSIENRPFSLIRYDC
jgi:hypothetical protein